MAQLSCASSSSPVFFSFSFNSNNQKSVRNNLTRAGFDYDVDFASQEKLKVAHCIQAIEHECPLFKRFKASWGAEYVLREVWSNRNEWLDKTNSQPPGADPNNHSADNEDDRVNSDDGNNDEQHQDDDGEFNNKGDEEDDRDDEQSRCVILLIICRFLIYSEELFPRLHPANARMH
ncbi:hypothetical protein B0H19DRAFT_1103288 [Mycena capillaripes]|nr:hypothetical protein B0H19DRAFT_1103288 [Mycena capillaripes]